MSNSVNLLEFILVETLHENDDNDDDDAMQQQKNDGKISFIFFTLFLTAGMNIKMLCLRLFIVIA